MGTSVKKLPSINVPFVDSNGRMHPIWYEYFRSFIAGATETSNSEGTVTSTSVEAGNGLVFSDDDVTLNVGNGSGITVNANDVNVDISNASYSKAELQDDMLISDVSDNNNIRKTKIEDITALAGAEPAGNDTEIQYNNGGRFGADSSFTYDGSGNVDITGSLSVNNVEVDSSGGFQRININALGKIIFGDTASGACRIQTSGGGEYILYSEEGASLRFNSGTSAPGIVFNLDTGDTIRLSSGSDEGMYITGDVPLRRCTDVGNTASTTQTQGQGVLTGDINEISTVANDNDTVTLPTALLGRYCTVINNGANILQVFPSNGDDLGEGTNNATTLVPGEHSTWVCTDGAGTTGTTWRSLDGKQRHSIEAGITASTTQSQGQQPLTKEVNEVSTVANTNDTVTLPAALTYAKYCTIINNGANTLQIFPASGDNLGAGVDTATTLASGSNITFVNYDATNWESV